MYFATNSSNLILTGAVAQSNVNSVFPNLTASDGILINLNDYGWDKNLVYTTIS
jgi:hypothetical protein